MAAILSMALPFFGLILLGYVTAKVKKLDVSGLAWMNFFIVYRWYLFRPQGKRYFFLDNIIPFCERQGYGCGLVLASSQTTLIRQRDTIE